MSPKISEDEKSQTDKNQHISEERYFIPSILWRSDEVLYLNIKLNINIYIKYNFLI